MRMTRPILLLLLLSVSFVGCESKPPEADQSFPRPPESTGDLTSEETPPERSTVELPGATAVLQDEGIVKFDIEYRFTSGSPRGYYLVNIAFPGTENNGIKPMDASELETAGTITTRIEVGDAPVDGFEITMSEADSPDQGYFVISEPLTGNIQRPGSPEPDTTSDANSDDSSQ